MRQRRKQSLSPRLPSQTKKAYEFSSLCVNGSVPLAGYSVGPESLLFVGKGDTSQVQLARASALCSPCMCCCAVFTSIHILGEPDFHKMLCLSVSRTHLLGQEDGLLSPRECSQTADGQWPQSCLQHAEVLYESDSAMGHLFLVITGEEWMLTCNKLN